MMGKSLPKALEALAGVRRYDRGEKVYGQTDPTDYWYRVISGMAKKYTLRLSGREQIIDFLLPGDFFGFGAKPGTNTTLLSTQSSRTPHWRATRAGSWRNSPMRSLKSRGWCAKLRSRRVRACRHGSSFKGNGATVMLSMSRYDIADYLSISVETVSRTLTILRRRGAIAFNQSRHAMTIDRDALEGETTSEEFGLGDSK
jgi:CRP-like cAMP-binding protein